MELINKSHEVNYSYTGNTTDATTDIEDLSLKFWHWIIISLFCIVFIVGLFGNGFVVDTVLRKFRQKSSMDYCLANLAVSDFLVILLCTPPTLILEISQAWHGGEILCKFVYYFQKVSVYVSVLTLTYIAFERYQAICRSLRSYSSRARTMFAVTIIWTVSLAVPFNDLFNVILAGVNCFAKDRIADQRFNITSMILFYVLPLSTMVVLYVKIIRRLRYSASENNVAAKGLNLRQATEILVGRRRSARMLVFVVMMFGLCYLFYNIIIVVDYFDGIPSNFDQMTGILWPMRLLIYSNSAMNPVIYLFMCEKFRNEFLKIFPCCSGLFCLPSSSRCPQPVCSTVVSTSISSQGQPRETERTNV